MRSIETLLASAAAGGRREQAGPAHDGPRSGAVRADHRDDLLSLVLAALILADELVLTDVGIALDKARVSLAEPPGMGSVSIAFH
jgi:hypothetical protein